MTEQWKDSPFSVDPTNTFSILICLEPEPLQKGFSRCNPPTHPLLSFSNPLPSPFLSSTLSTLSLLPSPSSTGLTRALFQGGWMAGGCPDVLLPEDSSELTLITAFNLAAALELLGFAFVVAPPSGSCFLSPSVLGAPGAFFEGP